MTEAQWQAQVVQLAELYGWAYLHIRPARIRDRHLTPVAGALGPGWPDLVLVRERVVYAELKADRGTISGVQHAVHAALRAAGCEVHVWRPRDFGEVKATLERRGA
jgi:hypothetical protein